MNNLINFKKNISPKGNEINSFFIQENLKIDHLKNLFSKQDLNKISIYLNNVKKEKKTDAIFSFDMSERQKIIFIKINDDEKLSTIEQAGATFYIFLKKNKLNKINLYSDTLKRKSNKKNILHFIHGLNLKSYTFNKYKSFVKDKSIFPIIVFSKDPKFLNESYKKYYAIESGVNLTRDLVSEPPNVLNPKKYVEIIKKLSSLGLKIKVYNEKKLKSMGMNALLGVGQGSINETFLVTLEWRGNKASKDKPLAFVGKGVCFDTGGISLKPARFMEEMKYDMGGSAVVVGLLKTLAIRKAKINAVGVVGLVENMPGGNAQRPGDIVKSYSGKTIEVLNTDAEGRLVLADALSFTEKKFKPKFIIDLATLTGAIIMALGEEYAGLFSNNDDLSEKIFKIGNEIGEKVWRLPLHENYNKLMNSTIADVQNINYVGGAGSITAAEFLQRFILNKTPWAHLDIAGMAFSKKAANLNPSGATGFGVRLLNQLVEEYYE